MKYYYEIVMFVVFFVSTAAAYDVKTSAILTGLIIVIAAVFLFGTLSAVKISLSSHNENKDE